MNMTLKTILVELEDGAIVTINATDFNPEIHTAAGDAAAGDAAAVSPVQMLVAKTGRKHFVVTTDGEKITDVDGIDPKGYNSEKAAWAAVTAMLTTG